MEVANNMAKGLLSFNFTDKDLLITSLYLAATILTLILVNTLPNSTQLTDRFASLDDWKIGLASCLILSLSTLIMASMEYSPFLYYNF